MDVKPYPKGEPTKPTRNLFKMGVLRKYPEQTKREDLESTSGVDIVFHLKGVTPAVFKETVDAFLLAAYAEGERYKEEAYKFAKFTVEMDLNAKGRTAGISTVREYIAAKNPDTDTMVWGTETPPGSKRPFLTDKADEIIEILDSDSPGPYLKRKTPYKVVKMTISIREDRKAYREETLKKLRESLEPKMEELRKKVKEQRGE